MILIWSAQDAPGRDQRAFLNCDHFPFRVAAREWSKDDPTG